MANSTNTDTDTGTASRLRRGARRAGERLRGLVPARRGGRSSGSVSWSPHPDRDRTEAREATTQAAHSDRSSNMLDEYLGETNGPLPFDSVEAMRTRGEIARSVNQEEDAYQAGRRQVTERVRDVEGAEAADATLRGRLDSREEERSDLRARLADPKHGAPERMDEPRVGKRHIVEAALFVLAAGFDFAFTRGAFAYFNETPAMTLVLAAAASLAIVALPEAIGVFGGLLRHGRARVLSVLGIVFLTPLWIGLCWGLARLRAGTLTAAQTDVETGVTIPSAAEQLNIGQLGLTILFLAILLGVGGVLLFVRAVNTDPRVARYRQLRHLERHDERQRTRSARTVAAARLAVDDAAADLVSIPRRYAAHRLDVEAFGAEQQELYREELARGYGDPAVTDALRRSSRASSGLPRDDHHVPTTGDGALTQGQNGQVSPEAVDRLSTPDTNTPGNPSGGNNEHP